MAELIGILGSVTPPGRLLRALDAALASAAGVEPGIGTRLINLADERIAFADGRPPEQLGDDTANVIEAIGRADAVILASPVYRASFTGALKNLLDHIPIEALAGKPCGIVAMGATQHHYLGVDSHLRDVLAWFGALVAPASVYLTSADFVDGQLSETARRELAELITTVLRLRAVAPRAGEPLGPAPLAARRG
jgi:FMN reductase